MVGGAGGEGLGRADQELGFGRVKLEMPSRYPSGETEWVGVHISLEFGAEV